VVLKFEEVSQIKRQRLSPNINSIFQNGNISIFKIARLNVDAAVLFWPSSQSSQTGKP
jgi:hypothetical protein